jgi:CRP-like cAMP-binding protein
MFDGYTAFGIEQLLERGAASRLDAGDVLYREGEAATFVALVVSGRLALFVTRQAGEVALPDAGPGRLLGELAVLAGATRVMTARAADATVVVRWTADVFRRLLANDAQLSQRIFRETYRSIIEERNSLVAALASADDRPPAA